uniref:Uncharacterized protein n=1 Tax=Anguilla anguilla TaxID=7936 RepID=A0A0E9PJB3_ANGAN
MFFLMPHNGFLVFSLAELCSSCSKTTITDQRQSKAWNHD